MSNGVMFLLQFLSLTNVSIDIQWQSIIQAKCMLGILVGRQPVIVGVTTVAT